MLEIYLFQKKNANINNVIRIYVLVDDQHLEHFIMFDNYQVNYECKVILHLNTIFNSTQLINKQLFYLYTNICDELANGLYQMHPFPTTYVYFGQTNDGDFLKFNFIVNPFLLVDNQKQKVFTKKSKS